MTRNAAPEIVVVGSANVDLVTRVRRLPAAGETVLATGYAEHEGGKGANQAIAAARLGRRVAFVGVVGDDDHGARLATSLAGEGVDVAHLGRATGAPTGRALVLVDDDAENSIVVVPGANARLRPDDVASAAGAVRAAAVVVAQLEVPLAAVQAAAETAGGVFVLNPAPARPLPRDLLDHVDVLVVNEGEFARVTGLDAGTDPSVLAARVDQAGLRCAVVVTLGGRGAMACERGHVTACPAPPVAVADTTGAGDCFVGALADALARGEQLGDALRWAVTAASLSTQSLGATTAMPDSAAVTALLAAPAGGAR